MPLPRRTLEKRAVKAGVKASVKLGHVVTEKELLGLRVQALSNGLRILLVLAGIALVASGCCAWPFDSGAVQGIEAISGIFIIFFGIFGVRNTLANLLDGLDAVDLTATILEVVAEGFLSLFH